MSEDVKTRLLLQNLNPDKCPEVIIFTEVFGKQRTTTLHQIDSSARNNSKTIKQEIIFLSRQISFINTFLLFTVSVSKSIITELIEQHNKGFFSGYFNKFSTSKLGISNPIVI